MSVRLGEVLVEQSLLTQEQLSDALRYQKNRPGRLSSILIELGYVTEGAVAKALSDHYGAPYLNLTEVQIDPETLQLIPTETAIRHQVLPIKRAGSTLTVAISDPTNVLALDELKFLTGYRVEPVVAAEGAIRQMIEQSYGSEQALQLKQLYDELEADEEYELDLVQDESDLNLQELEETSSEAPIIKLVNIIFAEAIQKGASDIHMEPYESEFRVRYRIDGTLYDIVNPPFNLREAMLSRIKIMANLDIGERRLPQDGRIRLKIHQEGIRKEIDLRVSSLPTLFGEKIVLRILDRGKIPLDLNLLGFDEPTKKRVESGVHRPYGMVLVTGPTGSGKTSTLYTCLNQLNTPEVNIMTAEDPVEFNFPGISQLQTREQIGLTFAAALRSFLHQDPNIIMVGEIRDRETAEIAVKAALTGHLVLSTLHTNDAPTSVTRLLDMGVEPFLVANSVHLICAQRLVRRICEECKQEVQMPLQALIDIGFPASEVQKIKVFEGAGCESCSGGGYRGRVGLFEVMEITPEIQELVLERGNSAQMRRKAQEQGMTTLRESGLAKIQEGVTTIEEVVRETATY